MKYASIKKYDIANGRGVRVSLFVSGCPHCCKNCFNEEAWDFDYGFLFTDKEESSILEYLQSSYIAGLSLLGGEPLYPTNQEGLLPLLRKVKAQYPEKDIWCYTGYLFDKEIMEEMYQKSEVTREILSYIDVLVDGRFIESKKDPRLYFRGSSNQRIIDVQKSLKVGKVVELCMEGEYINAK